MLSVFTAVITAWLVIQAGLMGAVASYLVWNIGVCVTAVTILYLARRAEAESNPT